MPNRNHKPNSLLLSVCYSPLEGEPVIFDDMVLLLGNLNQFYHQSSPERPITDHIVAKTIEFIVDTTEHLVQSEAITPSEATQILANFQKKISPYINVNRLIKEIQAVFLETTQNFNEIIYTLTTTSVIHVNCYNLNQTLV